MLKKYPLALYLTWIVILVLVPLPLVVMLHTSLLETTQNLIAYDLGIYAYVWWLIIIYLATRPKFLDRLIGLPVMYFIHGMLGVLALIGAYGHRLYAFSMHDEIKITGDLAWYLAVFLLLYAIFFMSGWLVDRFPVANKLKNKLKFLFKHELSIWIHRLNFLVIFLIWIHVHVINRLAILTPFMMLFDLYTVYFIGYYIWKKYVVYQEESVYGEVVSNTKLSSTVQQLVIKTVHQHKYQAGDFYFLSFMSDQVSKEKHPFSVASTPSVDDNLVFIIQAAGDYTKKIDKILEGTKVLLEGPFGKFNSIIANSNNQPLILYGCGSGIAPLISIAKEYKAKRAVHVIWSAKNEQEMYLHEEFQNLANQG